MKNKDIEEFIEDIDNKLRDKESRSKLKPHNFRQVIKEMLKHKLNKEDWIKDGSKKIEDTILISRLF